MTDYDFTSCLSPLDFELLSKDLLEAELGVRLENFREGRDRGIDLRYAPLRDDRGITFDLSTVAVVKRPPELIVQCKRYSSFSNLKAELKNNELNKISKLTPARYILTTSVSLSPQQAEELKSILSPFVQSTGDIFGKERLNGLLAKHQEIERRHIKLWISSAGVLDSIINAGTHVVSREEVTRTVKAAKLYVKNVSCDESLRILKEHRVCIISGIPGIGKTTLARMLLLYFYERGYDVVKIESDISEARSIGYHNRPRFYYYDDFLGQTAQADKLNKNEDQKLLDFMASVRDSKDVFVLTTREYILNQAKLNYEKLDREKFDHRTCIVDLSKYSRRIRAEILYNHLHYSDLPRQHLEVFVASRGYIKVVEHGNYNPRLIESLTSSALVGAVPPEDYLKIFLSYLDNPSTIWDHAYSNQISDGGRHFLLVLTTLPTEVMLDHLEKAFDSFHQTRCDRYGIKCGPSDFKRAVKELDGTFLAIRMIESNLLVRFQNPSIRDFMQNILLNGDSLEEILRSTTYFEQAHWFSETLHAEEPRISLVKLRSHERLVVENMKRLISAHGCSISILGINGSERLYVDEASGPTRLGSIAISLKDILKREDREFIGAQLGLFASQLAINQLVPATCLTALETLRTYGHLGTKSGEGFVTALKRCVMAGRSNLSGFETLTLTVRALPESFSEEEIEMIKGEYLSYTQFFEMDEMDDPEKIRDEASRIEEIGDLLGVDTHDAREKLHDLADEIEANSESDREWGPEGDDSLRGGGSEECTDQDIDSMFRTL